MLVLVRHGESEANAAGRLLGRLESPLTDRGRRQAAAVGATLGRPARLVSSPLGRARQSAEALGLGLPVEVDDRWVELDYGQWDGAALGEVPAAEWDRWRRDPSFRPPGGETLAEVAGRVADACGELFARSATGARGADDVVVVSHVSPIKAAVAWALDAPPGLSWRLHLATASVTRIGWAGGPVLHGFNLPAPAGA